MDVENDLTLSPFQSEIFFCTASLISDSVGDNANMLLSFFSAELFLKVLFQNNIQLPKVHYSEMYG